MFSKFFIDRPIFATVLAIIMVLAGLLTVRSLPVAQYPDITPPTVNVSASYPGADAETVARTVGVPIEQQINGVENTRTDAKRQLGYIPEMPAVYDLLTVSEHLEFIRRAYKQYDEAYSQQLLERLELWDKKDKLGKELSKGMQQKLSICCALCHKPRVVVFDEPLVGLDPHAIKELKNVFRELKAEGASVLISTHMIDSVEDYWDVANIMMNGRFAATKLNNGQEGQDLEELFFQITEGGAQNAVKEGGAV